MKRLLSFFLVLCLIPGLLGTAVPDSSAKEQPLAQTVSVDSHSGLLTIGDPTPDEIRAIYAQQTAAASLYAETPSVTAPYAAGRASDSYRERILDYINLYRYVAKVPALSLDEEKSVYAQHGAVLLAKLDTMSHNPSQPSDMSDEFYALAKSGARWSNISFYNFGTYYNNGNGWTWEQILNYRLKEMVFYATFFQVRDYDALSFRNVGHRRYLLSPYLQRIGFGMAETEDNLRSFYVMTYANSESPLELVNSLTYDVDYDYMAWPPSGNCPSYMFAKTNPWSVSLNEDKYPIPAILDQYGLPTAVGDRTGIVITVTRESDGKVWTFNDQSPDGSASGFQNSSHSAPFFCVNKNGYGYGPLRYSTTPAGSQRVEFNSNALVFRPDFEDESAFQGVYRVRISGLKDKNGNAAELSYEVNFFNIAPCTHTWSEWEANPAPTCEAAGTQTRKCTKCGQPETEELPALGHNWSDWTVTKEPGCVETGSQRRTCARCGKAETEPLEALGHDWGDWEEETAPTCTEAGEQSRTCARCEAEETEPIPALGHAWGDWNVIQTPDCTEIGSQIRICGRCGKTDTEDIPALGHDWGVDIVTLEPTCTDPGSQEATCARCGLSDTLEIPPLGHDWGEWGIETLPNCTDEGSAARTCARCGGSETEVIDALGHEWVDGEVLIQRTMEHDGLRIRDCSRCGASEEAVLPKLTDADNPFTDVQKKYYYKAVLWAYYHIPQITSGATPTTFGVKKDCTRADIVTFLWKAMGAPAPVTTENPFKDVKKGKYYYKAVLWAVEKGITSGKTADTFGVKDICTRGDMVTFLWAASGKPAPTSSENPFTDVKKGKYYYKAVLWAVENGVTTGTTATTFSPKKTCTRAEIVTFLYKFMGD